MIGAVIFVVIVVVFLILMLVCTVTVMCLHIQIRCFPALSRCTNAKSVAQQVYESTEQSTCQVAVVRTCVSSASAHNAFGPSDI